MHPVKSSGRSSAVGRPWSVVGAVLAVVALGWCVVALNVNDLRADTIKAAGVRTDARGNRDLDAAEEALRAAVRLNPWQAAYHIDLAGLCVARAAEAAPQSQGPLPEECGRWLSEAEQLLRRAISLERTDYHPYLALAEVYRFWAQFEPEYAAKGSQVYKDAVRTSPGRQLLYWEWGNFCLAVNRPEEAVERCRRAVSLDPRVGAAHRKLAELYLKLGQLRLAEREYEAAWALERQNIDPVDPTWQKLGPRRAQEHEQLADLFLRAGDRERAVHHLRETLSLNAGNTRAKELLARLASASQAGARREG